MKNEYTRGFHWSNKAQYAHIINGKEIMFGVYHIDGSTCGEMKMEWVDIGGISSPRLQIFSDAFAVLFSMPDLLEKLADINDKDFTDEEFVKILLSLDFKDLTKYGEVQL